MKNHLIFFIILISSLKFQAQNSQLFNVTWTLHELNLEENIILPTDPAHIGELTFDEIENLLSITNIECEKTFLGDFTSITNTNFELFDFVDPFGFGCSSDIAFNYLENHSLFYISDPADFPNNPFNYQITDENGVLTLTITNGNNDTAIYRNVPLSLEENELDNLKVTYSAQNETLVLTGYVLEPTIKIAIYNLAGQQQETSDFTNGTSINVKNLPTGIYLITLRNNNGQNVIRKFVKY